ncbi:MAG: expansin EXLX1 family cellulose-binding protein [Chloroflexota bacterium]
MCKKQPITISIGVLCFLVVSGFVLNFPELLGAQPTTSSVTDIRTGEGTFYGATGAGNCSFDPTPDNLIVAAMNETDYDTARLCGAYVEATGPKGTVVVRIVDRCPECKPGDIDFSEEAFALIADPIDGRVPISWHIVSPELDGPIVYRYKEGSSQYWTAVQIRNHRNPIATFEYQTIDGQFKSVPREMYNYFVEPSGMGPGPYTFRVTDIYGNVITDSGVPFVDSDIVPGSSQFPAAGSNPEPQPTQPVNPAPTTPAPEPTEGITIFDDTLADGWENWSWSTAIDFSHSATVYEGATSMAVTYESGWAGVSLQTSSSVAAANYEAITFWVYSDSEQILDVFANTEDGNETTKVRITAPAGSWQQVIIPMADLGNPASITRVNIQEASGNPQTLHYLDNLRLITQD